MRAPWFLALAFASTPTLADDGLGVSVYTEIDFFGYSEPVSIEQFAKDFKEDLKPGDTAFTHDRIELGVGWRNFRIGYVHRFDYVTSFTEDTALIHHANKNGIVLPQNREYELRLAVERLNAKGLKVGYTFNPAPNIEADIAATWYYDIADLQSGYAYARGDLEPLTDQLRQDIQAVIDGLSPDNRDLSPLKPLVSDVNATIDINYAYDAPKFDEPQYRQPVITGPQNPVISGVDFSAPDGSGYSFDFSVAWQVDDRLSLKLTATDIVNEFNWDLAPQTQASFDLNPALIDAIDVAQDFVDGEIVDPNALVDRHLNVLIYNADYRQEIPWRAQLDAAWDLNTEFSVLGWTPGLSLLGSVYRTETQVFPRVGLGFGETLTVEYDIAGEALALEYNHKYFFLRLMTDKFNLSDAQTFQLAAGVSISF